MVTSPSTRPFPAARPNLASRFQSAVHSAWQACVKWHARRTAAHHLASLDDRMLQDIGISRSEVESAIARGRSHPNRSALCPIPMSAAKWGAGRGEWR